MYSITHQTFSSDMFAFISENFILLNIWLDIYKISQLMSASKVHLTVKQKFKTKLIEPWSRFILRNMKFARLSGIVKFEESEIKYICQ